jgi:hypothetical protein
MTFKTTYLSRKKTKFALVFNINVCYSRFLLFLISIYSLPPPSLPHPHHHPLLPTFLPKDIFNRECNKIHSSFTLTKIMIKRGKTDCSKNQTKQNKKKKQQNVHVSEE